MKAGSTQHAPLLKSVVTVNSGREYGASDRLANWPEQVSDFKGQRETSHLAKEGIKWRRGWLICIPRATQVLPRDGAMMLTSSQRRPLHAPHSLSPSQMH